MTAHRLPLSHLDVPPAWRRVVERGRVALYVTLWLLWPAAAWLALSGQWMLLSAGLLGAALMPAVLQVILLPAHLLARRSGRAEAVVS
ncbi:MAG: hypothetical protein HYZ74_09405, partial [Elusimicrobia bacterium]|nr:hypothetical protein [Elusimicrobiota bacterium]